MADGKVLFEGLFGEKGGICVSKTVVIADDEPITRIDLSEIMQSGSYDVVGLAPTGMDAVELCKRHNPDLVILDVKMPILDGIKAASIIKAEQLAGCIVLLTGYTDPDIIGKAVEAGVTGFVTKPFDENSILPAVEVSMAKEMEINTYKKQLDKLNEKMQDRILIEKAKGILREEKDFTEEQAYQYMRKLAMDKGYKIATVANAVVLNAV